MGKNVSSLVMCLRCWKLTVLLLFLTLQPDRMSHGFSVADGQVNQLEELNETETTTQEYIGSTVSALTGDISTDTPIEVLDTEEVLNDAVEEVAPTTTPPSVFIKSTESMLGFFPFNTKPQRTRTTRTTRTTRSRTTKIRSSRSTTLRQLDPVRPFCQNRACIYPYRPLRPGGPFRRTLPTTALPNYYPTSTSKPDYLSNNVQRDPIVSVSPQPLNINLSIYLTPDSSSGLVSQQITIPNSGSNNHVVVTVRPPSKPTTNKPDEEEAEYYEDDSALKPYVEESELAAYGGIQNFKPLHQKRPNEEADIDIKVRAYDHTK